MNMSKFYFSEILNLEGTNMTYFTKLYEVFA